MAFMVTRPFGNQYNPPIVDSPVVLSWDPVTDIPGIIGYVVLVSAYLPTELGGTFNDRISNRYLEVTGTSVSTEIPTNWMGSWTVYAVKTFDKGGFFSPQAFASGDDTNQKFKVGAAAIKPTTPTNQKPGTTTSPGTKTATATVSFSWNSVSNATKYIVTIYEGSTTVQNISVTTNSYTTALPVNKTYRWNVAAGNSAGNSAATSDLYFNTPNVVGDAVTPPPVITDTSLVGRRKAEKALFLSNGIPK